MFFLEKFGLDQWTNENTLSCKSLDEFAFSDIFGNGIEFKTLSRKAIAPPF